MGSPQNGFPREECIDCMIVMCIGEGQPFIRVVERAEVASAGYDNFLEKEARTRDFELGDATETTR